MHFALYNCFMLDIDVVLGSIVCPICERDGMGVLLLATGYVIECILPLSTIQFGKSAVYTML